MDFLVTDLQFLFHRQILLTSEIIVFLGILFSFNLFVPYTVPQYVISGLIMFVAAEVLEGITKQTSAFSVLKNQPTSNEFFWFL